jgi:hypothetical protein
MKALLALTNHNIEFALQALAGAKNMPKISVLDIDHKVPAATDDAHILLSPTAAVTARNARLLNECPNIIMLVFDAPVLCKEIGCDMLDVEKQTLDWMFRYRHLDPRDVVNAVRRAMSSTTQVKIAKKQVDMSTKLLKRVYGSIMGKFLTFMYKVPDTDKRLELQKQLFDSWWQSNTKAAIEYINARYPRNAAAAEFIGHINGDDGLRFGAAVAEMRITKDAGKPISYAKLSKKHGVSSFDLRYFSKGRGRDLKEKEE